MMLVAALLFSVTLFALTAAVLTTGVAAQRETRYVLAAQKAAEAAESAVHLVLAKLEMPDTPVIGTEANYKYDLKGKGSRATRVAVRITAAGSDGADNDLDGSIDEPDEVDLFEVLSVARHDNVARALRVTIRRDLKTAQATSPVILGNSTATTVYEGSQHVLSGDPVDINGAPVPGGTLQAAIGVAGDPAHVISQLPTQDTVFGDPKVEEVPPLDVTAYVTQAALDADVTLAPGLHKPALGEWGTLSAPKLVYATGDLEIGSSESGAGVLVVDGDLDMGGGFEWTGLVIVTGTLTIRGGGSGTHLIGGALVQGIQDPAEEIKPDFRITGSSDMEFSPEAIRTMSSAMLGWDYEPLKWRTAAAGEEVSP
jgi:hypothetical protein